MATLIPTEEEECIPLVQYLEYLKALGNLLLFTHIPNETYTKSWGTKMKNKRMGVRKGFPDYIIILNNQTTIGIEMKRTKGSVTSKEQEEWVKGLTLSGVPTRVCYGFEEAKAFVEEFI